MISTVGFDNFQCFSGASAYSIRRRQRNGNIFGASLRNDCGILAAQPHFVRYLIIIVRYNQRFVLQNISFFNRCFEFQHKLLFSRIKVRSEGQFIIFSANQWCSCFRYISSRIYRSRIELERICQQDLIIAGVVSDHRIFDIRLAVIDVNGPFDLSIALAAALLHEFISLGNRQRSRKILRFLLAFIVQISSIHNCRTVDQFPL
ncbi:hypothetical protein D3C74_306480 [compost metagenome]